MSEIEMCCTLNQKRLYVAFKMMRFNFEDFLENKQTRKRLQGLAYLLQKFNFPLGYNFRVYANGLFSKELATDAYRIALSLDYYVNCDQPYHLNYQEHRSIEKAKGFAEGKLQDGEWLNLLTTADLLQNSTPAFEKQEAYQKLRPSLVKSPFFEKAWKKTTRAPNKAA